MREGAARALLSPYSSPLTCFSPLVLYADLIALDREIGDYVIVHELLHFFVPNPGKLWKRLMRAHLGDYEVVRARLPARHTARDRR